MTNVLVEHGSHQQKLRWCPGIVKGEVIQAMGLTEPGSGAKANLLYVIAKTDDDIARGRSAMTMFLVDGTTPGVTIRRMDTIGMRASNIGEWFFADVRVPASNILGSEGDALRKVLKGTFTFDRTLIATRALATAELAFKITLDYVKQRKVFGQPVFEFQNTQFKLAEMKTQLVAGVAFRDSLLRSLAAGTLDVLTATTDTFLQLHGGYGYMSESAISRIYTYARVEPIYGGTNEVQKVNIAKALRG